jgi:hypothetical protein
MDHYLRLRRRRNDGDDVGRMHLDPLDQRQISPLPPVNDHVDIEEFSDDMLMDFYEESEEAGNSTCVQNNV